MSISGKTHSNVLTEGPSSAAARSSRCTLWRLDDPEYLEIGVNNF